MENYVIAAFDSDTAAENAFHALWKLDDGKSVIVHGAAVVRRNAAGDLEVATKRGDDPGVRTALGLALGALIGAIAGPVGAAAGAGISGGIMATTTLAGAAVGLADDEVKSGEHHEAASIATYDLRPGQYGVVADVTENNPSRVDDTLRQFGATINRRDAEAVRTDGVWGDDSNLYPYDYDPYFT